MSREEVQVRRVEPAPGAPATPGGVGRNIQRTGCGFLLLKWLSYAVAIWVTAWLFQPHVELRSFGWAIIVAAVLGFLNAIVRPVLILLTLPITILTLGLFLIVINALMLYLASAVLEGFEIDGFLWALAAAIVISLINLVLDAFMEAVASRRKQS